MNAQHPYAVIVTARFCCNVPWSLPPCQGLVKDPEGVRAGLEAAGDRATDYEVERTKR